jgi:hypothetical protein
MTKPTYPDKKSFQNRVDQPLIKRAALKKLVEANHPAQSVLGAQKGFQFFGQRPE